MATVFEIISLYSFGDLEECLCTSWLHAHVSLFIACDC